MCGHPKVREDFPRDNEDLEYCFWENDVVSRYALKNFSFEKENWEWVARSFSAHNINNQSRGECDQLSFLDVGINVGDWISPIRLLAPEIPVYGVEGSPPTAAIATANLRISIEHSIRAKTPPAPSKVLPFSLLNPAQIGTIHQLGGICFSKTQYFGGSVNAFNVGGRHVTTNSDCPASDAAGATTLLHALKGLVHACPALEWPRVFIMKIDVEGHEFKALSSVVHWLSEKPPCFISLEYTSGLSSSDAMLEMLLDVGYDAAWRPRENEFPKESTPWWDRKTVKTPLHKMIRQYVGRGYSELIVGFTDVDACISNLHH